MNWSPLTDQDRPEDFETVLVTHRVGKSYLVCRAIYVLKNNKFLYPDLLGNVPGVKAWMSYPEPWRPS